VRRPRRRHDRDRYDAAAHVGCKHAAKLVGIHPLMLVRSDLTDVRAADSEHGGRALNGVVGLGRGVDRDTPRADTVGGWIDSDPFERTLARRAQGDEVRDGSAARVNALQRGIESAKLRQPLEGELLEPVEGGDRVPLRARDRRRCRHGGGQGVGRDRDEAPPAGLGEPHSVRQDVPLELA
jgi:hypothetical protein